MPDTQNKFITMDAGEYYIAAELSRQGYKARVVHQHKPHRVDVEASDPTTQQTFIVQVQAVRSHKGWAFMVDKNVASYPGFLAFVVLPEQPTMPFTTYLLTPDEAFAVSDASREKYEREHPNSKKGQDPMLREGELVAFLNNWHRLSALIRETADEAPAVK